jgi:hypothetical protein
LFLANGLMNSTVITRYLTNQAIAYLPLTVMNLPGKILTNSSFTIQGIAKTNPFITGAIVNVAISNIMWRLESGTGSLTPFQPATALTKVSNSLLSWSQPRRCRLGRTFSLPTFSTWMAGAVGPTGCPWYTMGLRPASHHQ